MWAASNTAWADFCRFTLEGLTTPATHWEVHGRIFPFEKNLPICWWIAFHWKVGTTGWNRLWWVNFSIEVLLNFNVFISGLTFTKQHLPSANCSVLVSVEPKIENHCSVASETPCFSSLFPPFPELPNGKRLHSEVPWVSDAPCCCCVHAQQGPRLPRGISTAIPTLLMFQYGHGCNASPTALLLLVSQDWQRSFWEARTGGQRGRGIL